MVAIILNRMARFGRVRHALASRWYSGCSWSFFILARSGIGSAGDLLVVGHMARALSVLTEFDAAVVALIVSSKEERVPRIAFVHLELGLTVIPARGGYTGGRPAIWRHCGAGGSLFGAAIPYRLSLFARLAINNTNQVTLYQGIGR